MKFWRRADAPPNVLGVQAARAELLSARGATVSPPDRNLEEVVDSLSDEDALVLLRRMADGSRQGVRRRLARLLPAISNLEHGALSASEEPSLLAVATGTRDWESDCVVGRNGFLYVLEGSNSLYSNYELAPEFIDETAEAWTQLITQRMERLQRSGAQFLQLIIPEKSTAIPDNFPYPLPREATPLLLALEARMASQTSFLSCRDALCDAGLKDFPFRKADSHLSPEGCRSVTNAMLARLGVDASFAPFEAETKVTHSDLGSKFPPLRFLDVTPHPVAKAYEAWESRLTVERHYPERDGFRGLVAEFTNPGAPLDVKVMAFANSFFGAGESPTTLGWWASRAFRSFLFHWNSEIDYALVEAERPDVVICQTNERFLPAVPIDC